MELIYLFDPLCGWCYGFGNQLQTFKDNFEAKISFNVISGGMVTGSRVGTLSEIAPYIKDSLPRVEQLSGVKFGSAFLEDLHGPGKTILDSTPPSKAFVILKEAFPLQQVEVAHAIQEIFYGQGLDLNRAESYAGLCQQLGYDFNQFTEDFEGLNYQLATKDAFSDAARYGVSGYPTVILHHGNAYYMVSSGFTTAEKLSETLQRIFTAENISLEA